MKKLSCCASFSGVDGRVCSACFLWKGLAYFVVVRHKQGKTRQQTNLHPPSLRPRLVIAGDRDFLFVPCWPGPQWSNIASSGPTVRSTK